MYVPGLQEKDQHRINQAIRELAAGRSNGTGTVTLIPSATATTVSFYNCMADSIPFLQPMTASAAAAGAYVFSVGKGQFVIHHLSNAATDQTFGFACLG